MYLIFKDFLPRNWFQFVDDVAAVTSLDDKNSFSLKLFSKLSRWSEMIIKAINFHSFGICKNGMTSAQCEPNLYYDNALVSPVKLDEGFTYLGRYFDFKITDNKYKVS